VTDTLSPPSGIGGAAPKNLAARLAAVIFSPGEAYASIVAHPRVFGALVVAIVASGLIAFAFLSTEVGRNAALDQQVRMMESFGFNLPDEVYDQMERGAGRSRYFALGGVVVWMPLLCAVVAGLMQLIFSVALGGDASFKQAYAVAAHSQILIALQQAFVTPLNYVRETMSSATNLGVFLPMLDETSFAARLLGSIDLFWIWWIVNLAIGIAVLYKRKTAPVAWSLLAVYLVIALAIAIATTALGGA
jgi:hypothetical protein